MQSLGTNKNHATSWDEKKSCKLSGQKNYANSQEKKDHATSQDITKVMQPFGTKKSRNLLRLQKKSC